MEENSKSIMTMVKYCNTVASVFEPMSQYYDLFRTKTLGKTKFNESSRLWLFNTLSASLGRGNAPPKSI